VKGTANFAGRGCLKNTIKKKGENRMHNGGKGTCSRGARVKGNRRRKRDEMKKFGRNPQDGGGTGFGGSLGVGTITV